MTETTELDLDARYTGGSFKGVALVLLGWEKRWEPAICFVDCDPEFCDEDCDLEHEVEDHSEGEWVDDIGGMVRVRMVGDDAVHLVDLDDLEKIAEDEYCHECGQTGCGWGGGESS